MKVYSKVKPFWFRLVRLRIYDYEKGIETLIYQTPTGAVIYDNPYGYTFNSYGQGEIMDVFPNEDVINHYSNSIIKLKEGVYDTLKVHLTGTQVYGSRYDSIWYNSKLQVPVQGIITIVK